MKCRRCRAPAVIDVRRHNAGFCRDCFLVHCHEQVRKTLEDFDMLQAGDRVLVAVSGGKDSLALWDILRDLGHDADGLYLGLGIGEYSDESGTYARAYADKTGARSERVVWPVAVGFFDRAMMLAAWCQSREAFRHFRLDRMEGVEVLPDRPPRARRTLLRDWRRAEWLGG